MPSKVTRIAEALAIAVLAATILAACSNTKTASGTGSGNGAGGSAKAGSVGTELSQEANYSIAGAPVRVANTSDGKVSYREIGSGHPLLLIMGYSSSMDGWQPAFVNALAAQYKVVMFDNMGIGQSTVPQSGITVPAMADQTAALIRALGLGKPYVLGWSMGGMISQALAATHPGLVGKLVLCSTLPGNGHAVSPPSSVVATLASPGAAGLSAMAAITYPPDHVGEFQDYIHSLVAYPGFYMATQTVDTTQMAAMTPWVTGQTAAGKALSSIRVPTLIGDGAEDAIVPIVNDNVLHQSIKGSQLVIYPDASHAFLFQSEDEANWLAKVKAFLG